MIVRLGELCLATGTICLETQSRPQAGLTWYHPTGLGSGNRETTVNLAGDEGALAARVCEIPN